MGPETRYFSSCLLLCRNGGDEGILSTTSLFARVSGGIIITDGRGGIKERRSLVQENISIPRGEGWRARAERNLEED